MVSLNADHRPTDQYVRQLRLRLNQQFPGALLYFLPSDIVTQTINFGLPAPFDIQLVGRNVDDNRRVAAPAARCDREVRQQPRENFGRNPRSADFQARQTARRRRRHRASRQGAFGAVNKADRRGVAGSHGRDCGRISGSANLGNRL